MNGLAKITIDDREVVLKFGLPAIRRIMGKIAEYKLVEKTGDQEIYNDLGLSHILYAGYLNACEMRDELPSLLFESFYLFVEEGSMNKAVEDQIISAIKSFEDSKVVRQAIEKVKEEAEKKSLLIGTISNHSPMESSASSDLNSVE